MSPYLITQRGPEIGRRYDLNNSQFTMGRGHDNDLVLGDAQVSRYHAVIRQENEGVVIIDLGSTNPVVVNDSPLEPGSPQRLQHRDIITLGQSVFCFQNSTAAPSPPARGARPAEPATMMKPVDGGHEPARAEPAGWAPTPARSAVGASDPPRAEAARPEPRAESPLPEPRAPAPAWGADLPRPNPLGAAPPPPPPAPLPPPPPPWNAEPPPPPPPPPPPVAWNVDTPAPGAPPPPPPPPAPWNADRGATGPAVTPDEAKTVISLQRPSGAVNPPPIGDETRPVGFPPPPPAPRDDDDTPTVRPRHAPDS